MTTTIGSLDLNSANSLYNDATQYFWFESDSTATYGAGVHITLSPSATFMSNPTGQNILINTDGISIRNGLLPMMTLDNDSLDFNVVDTTNGTYTNVASFGSVVSIGTQDAGNILIGTDGITINSGDPANGGGNLLARSNGIAVRYGSKEVAQFGTSTILGSALEPHIELSSSGIVMVAEDNNPVVSIDSGTPQTLWTTEDVKITINDNESIVYSINLKGAGIGKQLDCNLEDEWGSYYTETFSITLGTASSGSGMSNILYSYTYDGNSTLTITNDNNGSPIRFDYIGYFRTNYTSQSYIQGELMMVNSSDQVGVWLTGSGNVDAKGYYINGTKLSDYIIETDGAGIWKWNKYASGKIECWGEKSWSNVACTTSAGGGYRSADVMQALPSGLFTAIDSCQATMKGSGGSGYAMILRTLCTNTTVTQMFWNTSSATKTTLTVDYYIIGT